MMKERMKVLSALMLAVEMMLTSACSSNAGPADTICHGGDILTMNGDTPSYAEAVAVNDGQIVFVGTRAEAFRP